jgi:hypothetical protein
MKTETRRWIWVVIGCAVLLASKQAFALGSDYPNDKPVTGSTNWPNGLERLVNATNRVHGYFVNAEDIFFFSGNAPALTAFLRDYSRLPGVDSHRLILHDGTGAAKSPWEKTGRVCDWKLYACPKGWHNVAALSKSGTNSVEALRTAAKEPGYVVEVHFWTGRHIALDQIDIPKNVVVQKER